MKCIVLYILLSSHDNEQWDLVHRINATRELELIPEYKELLELFINQEIITWKETLLKKYEIILRQGTQDSPVTDVFLIFYIIGLYVISFNFVGFCS